MTTTHLIRDVYMLKSKKPLTHGTWNESNAITIDLLFYTNSQLNLFSDKSLRFSKKFFRF